MWKETIAIITRGELVDLDRAVYPMLLRPEPAQHNQQREARHAMLFHFAMWLNAHPDVRDFRIMIDGATLESPVVEVRGHPIWVIFGKRKDRTAFTKWLAKYRAWFVDRPIEENFLPEFPENGRVTVNIVSTPFMWQDFMMGADCYPDGFSERWAWVIEHCRKPVFLMPTRGLAFTNAEEGMHFKLRWC